MESAELKRIVFVLLTACLAACGGGSEDPGGTGGSGGGDPAPYDLHIPGMEGAADVSFDDHGVLHASCVSDGDCLRVLGYFHASHRFWQMDLQRRAARGRLATLIPIQLAMDVENRAMFSTPEGEPLEEAIWPLLDEEERALLESYSEGVNAWLADLRAGRNGAKLSEEYAVPLVVGVPELIPDWEPLDSVAFIRLMTFLLSDSSSNEIAFGNAFAKLAAEDPAAAVDFLTLRPGAKTYTVPRGEEAARALRAAPDLDSVRALATRLRAVEGLLDEAAHKLGWLREFGWGDDFGSNNWVLAPARTENGRAILANDPHLALSNPSIFYLAHLDSKTQGGSLHVAGATFPGIPAVVIGRNEQVAWGATVAYYDVTDVYVEPLTSGGDAVRFDGADVPLVRKEVAFEVGGRTEPHRATLEWVPHHGPVVAKDPGAGTALSVRWVGHTPSNELRAFLGLNRAGNVAEAREALRHFEVGAQNIVLADVDGSIGWYPHAHVPNRPWASYAPLTGETSLPPWMPLPGHGGAEWEGMLPEEDLPSLFDPSRGFIATANQDLIGATEHGDPTSSGMPLLQTLPAPGFRMARIVDRLEAGGAGHTVESTHALQMDTYSEVGAVVVPALVDAAGTSELSEPAQRLVEVLAGWNLTCPTGLSGPRPDAAPAEAAELRKEAAGCTAFHFTLPRLMRVAFGRRFDTAGLRSWNANLLIRPLIIGLDRPQELVDPDAFWNDLGPSRTRDEVLVEALEKAGQEIVGPMGADPAGWMWGKIHTVTFGSELSMLAPHLDLGPYAAPGGLFTVNVANPSIGGGGFSFSSGASLRIVNELGDGGITTWLQLPGGQDLHRDSPHYGDWVERWLEGTPVQLPFAEAEVEEAAATSLRVGPPAN
jgi:penicillin amidase